MARVTSLPEAPTGPTSHGPDQGPRATRDEIRDLGRLRRSATDRKVAGVAGGLARHLDIDPLVLRVAFVVLAFFGGAGLLLYGACWLLVPEEETGHAPVTLDERSRTVALLEGAFANAGDLLEQDPAARDRLNRAAEGLVAAILPSARAQLAGFIAQVVAGWDTAQVTEKIELRVGRDLQYVRMNGTLVGFLVGGALFALLTAVFGRVAF